MFVRLYIMNTYEEMEVQCQSFLNSSLAGVTDELLALVTVLSRQDPSTCTEYGTCWAPNPAWTL